MTIMENTATESMNPYLKRSERVIWYALSFRILSRGETLNVSRCTALQTAFHTSLYSGSRLAPSATCAADMWVWVDDPQTNVEHTSHQNESMCANSYGARVEEARQNSSVTCKNEKREHLHINNPALYPLSNFYLFSFFFLAVCSRVSKPLSNKMTGHGARN